MLQCYLTSIASIIFLLVLASIYLYSPVETTPFYTNSHQCDFPGIPGAKFKAACINSVWNWLFPTLFVLLFISILILFILCICNLCYRGGNEQVLNSNSWLQTESSRLINRTYEDSYVYTYGAIQFENSNDLFSNRPPPPSYFSPSYEPPPPYSASSTSVT